MTPEEEVATWPPVPRHQPPRPAPPLRIPQGQSVTQRIARMQVTDPVRPEEFQADDALRQLRMERARRAHEARFGRPAAAGASMLAQGHGADLDSLLQRVKLARQAGWRPRRT